jgi:hypothetical protein
MVALDDGDTRKVASPANLIQFKSDKTFDLDLKHLI